MRLLSSKLLFLVFFITLSFLSCKKEARPIEEEQAMNNDGIALNTEMMRMGNFFGNVFSNIVLIHVQGGPFLELKTTEFRELLEQTNRDNDFFIYNIHQQQTFDPSIINNAIDFSTAKSIDQQSVDMLARAIQFFKAQDRKVYLFGTSFGAYLIQELIAREGKDVADSYLLLAGRLDMEEIIWQSFSEGNTGGFIDGKTPFTGAPSTLTTSEQNLNKLFAGLAYKSYTQELAKYDDLPEITYGYGTLDEAIGQLTQNERALLITREANLLEAEEGHDAAIASLIDIGFEMAFSGK